MKHLSLIISLLSVVFVFLGVTFIFSDFILPLGKALTIIGVAMFIIGMNTKFYLGRNYVNFFGADIIFVQGKIKIFMEPHNSNHWYVRFTRWLDTKLKKTYEDDDQRNEYYRMKTRWTEWIADPGQHAHHLWLFWGRIEVNFCL